jgi:23S rRNA pseudouridine1911/1915/1917 synthase
MIPEIIEENEWLIAIDKPAGLIVHSDGRTEEPSLSDWVGKNFPELQGIGGDWVSPQGLHVALNGLVHRLDRTTSGVIIAAKSEEMFAYLREQFKQKKIEKRYLAWVYGSIPEREGRIVAEIMRSTEKPRRWYARATSPDDPRAAITDWKVLESIDAASLVEITPQTGRTHQIRVHMAYFGHPVVSDHLYANDKARILGFERPALHAWKISTPLPNGATGEYQAPLPSDFIRAQNSSNN